MNIPKQYDTPLKEDGDLKHDTGKLRYDLIPPETLKGLAEVLTYGAAKYEDWNWIKSTHPERYYGALMRHLESWRAGELKDDESGLPALEHVLFCAMALHWFSTVKGINMDLPYQDGDNPSESNSVVVSNEPIVQNEPKEWYPPTWKNESVPIKHADAGF